jgi:uncharacterized protein YbbK (DUF523 family)
MRESARPRVVVSKCLGFATCRYDGVAISDEFVERLRSHVAFMPVCPEMEIGLGCPRDSIRVVEAGGDRRLVQPVTGRDVTREMTEFARRFLDCVGEIDGFLLKSRSPSCGIKDVKVYAGPDEETPLRFGTGLFAAEVILRFPDVAVVDEANLAEPAVCRAFLTRVFRGCVPAEIADLIG